MRSSGYRTSLILCLLYCFCGEIRAQIEHSAFSTTGRGAATTFVTDYHSVGINPSNLGWAPTYEGKTIAIGFLEGSYSLHSQALRRRDLRREVINSESNFNWEDKREAARAFADAGFALNADVMLFGAAYHNDRWGGLAFQVRDRAQWSSRFNPLASELIFEGYGSNYFDLLVLASGDTIPNSGDLSEEQLAQALIGIATNPQPFGQLFNGSHIQFTWYREYNLSYGVPIIRDEGFQLHAGIGVKHLVGLGIIDIRAEGNNFEAFSSLSSDFDIDYGQGSVQRRRRGLPEAAGRGWGFDLGMSAIMDERFKLGVAVNNIGSINWTGNAYRASDATLQSLITDGLNNYNFFGGVEEFVTDSGILEWEEAGSENIALPSNFRVGGGMIVNGRIEVGVDVVLPLNDAPGNFERPVFAAGGHVMPLRWVQLSAGLSFGGNYGTKVPLGITFIAGNGTWEAGVASRDAVTFFAQRDPTISLALGFLRFRF